MKGDLIVKNEALGSKVTSATRLIISYLVTRVEDNKMLRHNFRKSIPTVLISSMILIVILPQHGLILVAKADQKGADFNL